MEMKIYEPGRRAAIYYNSRVPSGWWKYSNEIEMRR